MKTKKVLAMLSAITMMFSATVAYFPKLAGENAIIAKAEEMEEWESPPLDATENAEESTGFIEDITVISEPIAILANSEVTDDGWQYYADGDAITISGYLGAETNLVVPESIDEKTVTAIAERAFADNKKLASVELGSIQKLGYKIFDGCTNLKEITIPKSVTKTGYDSYGCLEGSSIETVTFEEGIANIPSYVCMNASSVKTIIMPEKEDTLDGYVIGNSAFEGTSPSSVTIPESVTKIGNSAFSGCALLTSVTIPDNVKIIDWYAFQGCKRLTDISLGKSVSSMGCLVFDGCTSLKEITIPKSVTKTGYDSYGCLEGSSIETVTFEEGIANIPSYVCMNASSVKTVIMPEKEDTLDGYVIENSAFLGTSITSVTIPESVTDIQGSVFKDCALLTDVVIPNNVNYIGDYCFAGCKRLKIIDLGSKVGTLGGKLLEGCIGLKEITIPKTVTETGNYWEGCLEGSSIEALMIESGMKTTPEYLAANCTSLRTVYLPDSVSEIGDYSFAGCKDLEKVKSNRTIFNFSAHSFEGCEKLDDSRFTVLDLENTYLTANSEQASVNGIVNYTLKYKLMPSVAARAENIELHINMPEGLTLLLDSVQSKNLNFDPEDIEDGVISVNSTDGELRFTARVTEVGDYQVSATLNFDYNNSWWEQTIGRLDVDCPDITIAVPENVNEFTAEVYGITQRNQNVEIYVNDNLAGTFTANEYTGKYKGSVALPKGKDGEVYSIYAQCGNMTSDVVKTTYSSLKHSSDIEVFSLLI